MAKRKPKVYITRKLPQKALEIINKECDVEINPKNRPLTREELEDAIQNIDGIITMLSDNIDKELLKFNPELKVIANYAVGYDNIDIKACNEFNILVSNTPEVLTETTADFTWALLMTAAMRIAEADKFVQRANDTQNYSWWKYAGSIAEEVANVRLSEPYDWINKSYPQSRRNKPPKSTYDNQEATLYREFKNSEGYTGSFSFQEFRKDILPLLLDQSEDERMNMVLSYSLSTDAMKGLDITTSQYENWLTEEKEIEDEQSEINQFGNETDSKEEEKGIFDF